MSESDKNNAVQAETTSSEGRRMGLAAVVVTVFLTLGKFMGMGKEMLLSSLGAGWHTDAFKFAYNGVVITLYTKVEKLLRPTFLPEFVNVQDTEGDARAWDILGRVTALVLVTTTILVILCMVFARGIFELLSPGLAQSPEDLARAVVLLRIMAPALALFSLSVMPELTLQSYKKFTLPALAEAIFRTSVVVLFAILLATIWPGKPPEAIFGAAWAVLFGSAIRLLAQLPGLRKRLGLFRLKLNIRDNLSVRTILRLMPPVVLGLIFASIRTWADMRFASEIGEGAYTCLDFARRIPDMLLQTLAMAVSVVVYPFLSEWAMKGEKNKLSDALVSTTRAMAFVFVPVSVALMLVSLPIIKLVYQHGQFASQQAELSALGVYWYSPGLFFSAMDAPINHWYFAFRDTATPNYMGVVFVLVHVLIGYLGVFHFGGNIRGKLSWVAAALTISKSGKVLSLYALLQPRLGAINSREVWKFAGKLVVSTAAMALALWALEQTLVPLLEAWEPPVGGVKLRALANLGVSAITGGAAYLAVASALRMEEMAIVKDILQRVGRKLRRGKG